MVIARCVVPVNQVFRTGLIDLRLSVDGGKNYPWWNKFYIRECSAFSSRVTVDTDLLHLDLTVNLYARSSTSSAPAF